jgi:FkbM family methyltransferase
MTPSSALARSMVPVALRKSVATWRATTAEAVGSQRWSKPALYGLDDALARVLPRHGTFVELGANDGYSQSNTYYLERVRGWSGVLIEPLPWLYRRCARLRRGAECFNVVCVAPQRAGEPVVMVDRDLVSVALGQQPADEERARLGRGRRVEVPSTTLSAVIDRSAVTRPTFLSVDVEGAERSVLAGLDLARHAPDWLLVETRHPDDISRLLDPWLVRVDRLTHHDHLYRRR